MKNRRNVVVSFLLIAVLLLSVGYAALTDNLTLTGEATLNSTESQKEWEKDIYFSKAELGTSNGTSGTADTCTVGTANNDTASFEVFSLAKEKEVATFWFEISNLGEVGYDATITIDEGFPTNTNEGFFKVTYEYLTAKEGGTASMTVPKGDGTTPGHLYIKVTVELLKNPTSTTTAAFTLTLTASSPEITGSTGSN